MSVDKFTVRTNLWRFNENFNVLGFSTALLSDAERVLVDNVYALFDADFLHQFARNAAKRQYTDLFVPEQRCCVAVNLLPQWSDGNRHAWQWPTVALHHSAALADAAQRGWPVIVVTFGVLLDWSANSLRSMRQSRVPALSALRLAYAPQPADEESNIGIDQRLHHRLSRHYGKRYADRMALCWHGSAMRKADVCNRPRERASARQRAVRVQLARADAFDVAQWHRNAIEARAFQLKVGSLGRFDDVHRLRCALDDVRRVRRSVLFGARAADFEDAPVAAKTSGQRCNVLFGNSAALPRSDARPKDVHDALTNTPPRATTLMRQRSEAQLERQRRRQQAVQQRREVAQSRIEYIEADDSLPIVSLLRYVDLNNVTLYEYETYANQRLGVLFESHLEPGDERRLCFGPRLGVLRQLDDEALLRNQYADAIGLFALVAATLHNDARYAKFLDAERAWALARLADDDALERSAAHAPGAARNDVEAHVRTIEALRTLLRDQCAANVETVVQLNDVLGATDALQWSVIK